MVQTFVNENSTTMIHNMEFPEGKKAKRRFINIFKHELFHSFIYLKFGIPTTIIISESRSFCSPVLKPFVKPRNLFKFILIEMINVIYDLIFMIYDKNTKKLGTLISNGKKIFEIIFVVFRWKRIIFKDILKYYPSIPGEI